MSARIRNLSIDCHDTYALAGFWAQVFGTGRQPDDLPGDPEAMVRTADGETVLFLQVPEGKTVKNRVHLCLEPTDRSRDAEVERLLALGATQVDDQRRPDGAGWVVLADPEGNEFCVLRSAAEREASA
ncbi:VOC family protein [Micromonospora carbonacea]|uniref:Glyoxalase-like domain-containing protein n=1 Tax=Micromonospora carbonacea TaxID=47853 RepID=A0A1C4WMS3_9ACTN|nr:VOC family protein [Micromonospora carbonacea]SCE97520.1 Glyoxalase-like domain-containing protein [Micromonospora carbonacea]